MSRESILRERLDVMKTDVAVASRRLAEHRSVYDFVRAQYTDPSPPVPVAPSKVEEAADEAAAKMRAALMVVGTMFIARHPRS